MSSDRVTPGPSPGADELIMGRLMDRLSSFGDRPALVTSDESVTYEELDRDCNRFANALLALGLQAGDRFAFLLPNGRRIVSCYLACARAGIVGVPLATRTTHDDLVYQLQDSGAVALLYAAQWADTIAEIRSQVPGIRSFICEEDVDGAVTYAELVRVAGDETPSADLSPADPFCIMYTGGTTGASKAAVQTHAGWAACILSTVEELDLAPSDRHVVVLPMTHAAWFTAAAHLCAGATTHLMERWDPHAVLELVERESLTTLHMIPTLLGDLVPAAQARAWNLASLRLLTLAGSPIPLEMYRQARESFGDIIGNIYGLTEAAGPVTYLLPRDMNDQRLRSGGRAGRYVEMAILDEAEESQEGFKVGEIGLRGPQITPGYLNRAEETRAAFRDGWFCTGDIGYVDGEGFLYILDRKKDMIKSGGFNVYPKEVEDVLYLHPDVVEAAAFGVPDEKWIEAVTAVVVLRSGSDCASGDVVRHCRSHLAGYKVPKSVHLTDALPRTSFGKFDKKALQRRYSTGATSAN